MPGYQTKQEHIAVRGVDALVIRSLLDRQQFADADGSASRSGISSATWPLFGLVWPSGAELAACMAVHPVVAGQRILEVGCGLALASLVGHRRGADMTASDHHPLAGAFLRENLRLNALLPMKYRHGDWSVPGAPSSTGQLRPPLPLRGRYDLIVGSDLLYDRNASVDLAGFIGRHAAEACEVWIVDPDRANRANFSRLMAGHGFALHERRLDRAESPSGAAYRGRLLSFSRGLGASSQA